MESRVTTLEMVIVLLVGALSYAQEPNILSNGDFSKGLACYGDYAWNNHYQFALSTDAHSAPYAAEIRCDGPCSKAAIFSGRIPAEAGKSYRIQFYSKCPTGGAGSLYLPKTSAGNVQQDLTCDGSWNLTRATFTPEAGATTFLFSIYNRGSESKYNLLIDDIVLTYSDGTIPNQPAWKHPGTRNVTLSSDTVSVDGSPYLALGFYQVPWDHFADLAAIGANTIMGPLDAPSMDCYLSGGEDILDRAYEMGLNIIPDSTTAARASLDNGNFWPNGSAGISTLPDIVKRYAPHLANIGWFLDDEPDQEAVNWYLISPPTLVREAARVRQNTTLPTLVSFQHAAWTIEDPRYDGSSDIWMAEPYGTKFDHVVTAITTLETIHQRPIWLFQNDIESTMIVPKAYFAIVNGATGLFYFNWNIFSTDTAGHAAVQQVFSELGSLKDVIFAPKVSVKPPLGITAMGRSYQGRTYVFAVNPNTTDVSGKISVPGLAAGKRIEVQFENRTIISTAGGFSDTFTGISRHVYSY